MLKLFLPVIFPSWRFFSSIGPSPRIHIGFSSNENDEPIDWQEFRPRPQHIPVVQHILHLFHNPRWNETLYINTCAERLFEGYSEMREQEIMKRILAAIHSGDITPNRQSNYVVYRISALIREGELVTQPVTFISNAVNFRGTV